MQKKDHHHSPGLNHSSSIPPVHAAAGKRRVTEGHAATFSFLTKHDLVKTIILSFIGAGILAFLYDTWNVWILFGFVGFFMSLLHFCYAGNRTMAFPLFLPVIFMFQHIVSSTYCYNHPLFMLKSSAVFQNEGLYFPMAALAGWSMYLGVVLPLYRAKPIVHTHKEFFSGQIKKRYFERILVITFFSSVLIGLLSGLLNSLIPGTGFLWLLLSKVSYVSILALGMIRSKKFTRLLLVLAVLELKNALETTIFHPFLFLVLMVSSLFLFTARKRNPLKVFFIIGVLAFAVYTLQCVKQDYRDRTNGGGDLPALVLAGSLFDSFADFFIYPTDIFSEKNLGEAMSRFDQGQIVSLVISYIPSYEPFAGGETVVTSLLSAVSLRAVSPEKYQAGGSNFTRFTGVILPEDTSRNLGQLGEFYGNFGPVSAVISCFIYALALGLAWRYFHDRSIKNLIWFAWFPFICLQMVKTEDGLGEIVNYFAKTAFVSFMIIKFVPEWKNLLGIKWRIIGGKRQRPMPGDIPEETSQRVP